jgi:hypothetical protein
MHPVDFCCLLVIPLKKQIGITERWIFSSAYRSGPDMTAAIGRIGLCF